MAIALLLLLCWWASEYYEPNFQNWPLFGTPARRAFWLKCWSAEDITAGNVYWVCPIIRKTYLAKTLDRFTKEVTRAEYPFASEKNPSWEPFAPLLLVFVSPRQSLDLISSPSPQSSKFMVKPSSQWEEVLQFVRVGRCLFTFAAIWVQNVVFRGYKLEFWFLPLLPLHIVKCTSMFTA